MSTGAVRLPILDSAAAVVPPSKKRLPLLDQVLAAQRDMSAVERFAQLHEDVNSPLMMAARRIIPPIVRPTTDTKLTIRRTHRVYRRNG